MVVTFGPPPLPPPEVLVLTCSVKSVAQMMLPPRRIRPQTRGITAPSVEVVTARFSSRAPSIVWPGAREETIQLSTTEPTKEPTAPPMVTAETPRTAPPTEAPMALPTDARTMEAISQPFLRLDAGNRKAKARRRRQGSVSGSSMTPVRS